MYKSILALLLLVAFSFGSRSSPYESPDKTYGGIAIRDTSGNWIVLDSSGGLPVSIQDTTGKVLLLESNGGVPVNIQDQTSRAIDARLCQSVTGPYLLTTNTIPNTYDIPLVDATGLLVGDIVGLFQNSTNPATYFGIVQSINTNTLTVDTPLDMVFDTLITPVLFEVICNMAVDGSVTPQIFSLDNDSDIDIDVTRVIIHITDGTVMDDGKFGGINALTNGVVFRKKRSDGSYVNYWNRSVKTNGEFGLMAYDKKYDDKAPSGIYGLSVRSSYGGQDKHGVTIRIKNNEELQLVVQDNLINLLTFEMLVQGHFVTD